jgi:hypothetical protein
MSYNLSNMNLMEIRQHNMIKMSNYKKLNTKKNSFFSNLFYFFNTKYSDEHDDLKIKQKNENLYN